MPIRRLSFCIWLSFAVPLFAVTVRCADASDKGPPSENSLGDFNGDGRLDARDIDALTRAVVNGTDDDRFDLNEDGLVNSDDRWVWVRDLKVTWFGDANLNRVFNTGDLVHVFKDGEYEDSLEQNSGWEQGDWNGDLEFGSGDLLIAFQDGEYLSGQRKNSASAVPEPSALMLLTFALCGLGRFRRRASESS